MHHEAGAWMYHHGHACHLISSLICAADMLLTSRLQGECTQVRGQLNISVQVPLEPAQLHISTPCSFLVMVSRAPLPRLESCTQTSSPHASDFPRRRPRILLQHANRQKILPDCCVTFYHTTPDVRAKCQCGSSQLDATCAAVCCCQTALNVIPLPYRQHNSGIQAYTGLLLLYNVTVMVIAPLRLFTRDSNMLARFCFDACVT